MAYRKIDPVTGFIEYKRTPEERSIVKLRDENQELRRKMEELEKMVNPDKKEE